MLAIMQQEYLILLSCLAVRKPNTGNHKILQKNIQKMTTYAMWKNKHILLCTLLLSLTVTESKAALTQEEIDHWRSELQNSVNHSSSGSSYAHILNFFIEPDRRTRMALEQQRYYQEKKHYEREEQHHLETEILKGVDTTGLGNLK